jgi:hypothetical protein
MSEDLPVFEPGSMVIVNGEPARIITVSIQENRLIRYEVGYWKAGEWKEVWLPAAEVLMNKHGRAKYVGFTPRASFPRP